MYPGIDSNPSQFTPYVGIVPNRDESPSSFGQNTPSGTPTGTQTLNYTNNTAEYMRMLSNAEKRELEIPRELYVNIKMLELLEKAFTFGKIEESDYHFRTENIVNRMDRLTQVLQQRNPNLTLDLFMQEYGLDDCTWAKDRIKKGKGKKGDHNVHSLVASVTSNFIRLPDYFYVNENNALVKDVLPMLEEMKQLLDMLKPHFSKPGHPFNLSDRYGPLIIKLSAMGLNDVLSKELCDEIKDVNEYARNTFQLFLR